MGLLAAARRAAYRRLGTADEPGTTLLTADAPGEPCRSCARWRTAPGCATCCPTAATDCPALLGGFHGTWATWPTLASARVVGGRAARRSARRWAPGVVLTPGADDCPVALTSRIVDYLAGQSAGRCGPCLNGLPAPGRGAARGRSTAPAAPDRVDRAGRRWSSGRGACAHPDGTVRLVRSLLAAMPGRGRPARRRHAAGPACARRPVGAERGVVSRQLRVDWPACQARGLCHELLPEVVDLDEWGYPIVRGEVTEELGSPARAAVRACPRLALRLVQR